jgi:DNA-binding beta-propeller fold protein YncE
VKQTFIVIMLLFNIACAEEFQGRPPIQKGIHYPMGTAINIADGQLYVVNSNFNLAYRSASIVAVDLKTHRFTGKYVSFDSFPGDFMLVQPNGAPGLMGYVAIRGNNSLTWFKIDAEGDEVKLICNDSQSAPAACQGDYIVTEGVLEGEEASVDEVEIGADPFGLAFLPAFADEPDIILLASMKGGNVAGFTVDETGLPVLFDQIVVASGLHSVAADPFSRSFYVSNKSYPLLHRFGIQMDGDMPTLRKLDSISLPSPFSTNEFGRGLAVADNGRKLVLAYRTPSALMVVEGADASSDLAQSANHVIAIGSRPGNVRVAPSGSNGQELAYVPCYGEDRLWVVDLESFVPVAIIETGAGPYDVATAFTDNIKRAYVSNFLDHTVSVIDIDPASPFYHTSIAEIH